MTTSNTIVLKDILPTPFNSNSRIMFINNLTGEIFVSTTEAFTSVLLTNTPVLSSTIYKINNKTPDAQNSVTLVANDVNAYTKQEVNSTFLKVNFSNLSGNIDIKGYKIENLDLTDPVSDGDAISNFYLNKRITELLAGEIISINNKIPDENGNVTLTAQDVGAYTTLQADALFRTKLDSYSKEELNSNVNTNISDPDSDNNIANKHYVDTVLSGKADTSHTHIINEITGLQSSLDSKADLTALNSYATTQALNNGLSGKANTTDLVNYLKKDGSVLLDNTYIPNNNYSIATKGYVDNSAPDLSNYFEKGQSYNFDAGTPALILTDTSNSSTTTLLGTGFKINRSTRTLNIDEAKIIFNDGSFQKLSINSFNANFTYKATSTASNYIWKMDTRQITDDILSSAYIDNTIMLKKDIIKPALVSIPVLATTIANGSIVNLNLGTPVLLSGDGVISDYISVASNIIKTTSTTKRIVSFSAGILGNYSASNGSRSYRLLVRRPAVVSVVGTNANDILNENTDAKLTTSNIADSEFNFSPTFTNGITDPFNIDGFVVSLDNVSGLSITTITSRVGYAKQSYIRIIFN